MNKEEIELIITNRLVRERIILPQAYKISVSCPDTNNKSLSGTLDLEDFSSEITIGLIEVMDSYKGDFRLDQWLSDPESTQMWRFLSVSARNIRRNRQVFYSASKRNLYQHTDGENCVVGFDFDDENLAKDYVDGEKKNTPVFAKEEDWSWLNECVREDSDEFVLLNAIRPKCKTTESGLNRFCQEDIRLELGWSEHKFDQVLGSLRQTITEYYG